jgi:hypothetical protein
MSLNEDSGDLPDMSIKLITKQYNYCKGFRCGYLSLWLHHRRHYCCRPWGKNKEGKGCECYCMSAGRITKHLQHLKPKLVIANET